MPINSAKTLKQNMELGDNSMKQACSSLHSKLSDHEQPNDEISEETGKRHINFTRNISYTTEAPISQCSKQIFPPLAAILHQKMPT